MTGITRVKIMNDAVNEDKIKEERTIRLKPGQKFSIEDEDGMPLFEIDNDTKKIKARGNVERL